MLGTCCLLSMNFNQSRPVLVSRDFEALRLAVVDYMSSAFMCIEELHSCTFSDVDDG